jgi:tetratricopeptide (TPR) repeat protein
MTQHLIPPELQQLRQQAAALLKNQQYAQALTLCQQIWDQYAENRTPEDGAQLAHTLLKNKQYAAALEICREVYKIDPDTPRLKQSYAWAIYYTEIAKENIPQSRQQQFLKAAKAILTLCEQTDIYSPYTQTILKVLKYLDTLNPFPADYILDWTKKLDPQLLTDQPFIFTDKKGVAIELASQKEQYYMHTIKALFERKAYQQCIDTGYQALSQLHKFHYNNDIWFKRRIALAYAALGNHTQALEMLNEILKVKNEWFIRKEIAQIYYTLGDFSKATQLAIDAALTPTTVDAKVNLIALIAHLLHTQQISTEQITTHLQLIIQIRKNNKWNPDPTITELLTLYPIDSDQTYNVHKIEKELIQFWQQLKFNNQKLHTGNIQKINEPHGKTGFIITTNKKHTYFFRITEFKGPKELLVPGTAVTFYLEKGFDQKKNKEVQNAVNIKPQ